MTLSLRLCGSAATPPPWRLVVAQGGPDALAAEHAALGGLAGDPLAVEITARAGAAALAQGALRAASTHLENAVRLAGANPPTEVLLLYRAGAWCTRLPHHTASLAVRRAALARSGRADARPGAVPDGPRRSAGKPALAGPAALHAGGGVAEGVESEEMKTLLRAWGCDAAQGFFIGRPMPPIEAQRWFEQNRTANCSA